ncbi:carboxypeptidase-like regulatory domain-containing protein [Adhaeretor mobilis]|uniref:carboxypeptidase-like regulatory domain-containing protein n=1 Tax=Adhaeretor mobilis TaxID=1930276 RepID=UPI0011A41BB8|nr:carboxypeptidase-like regulatory domain-containing protein [Adhaeretor mobilis]
MGTIQGTVTLGGKPVEGAYLTFNPVDLGRSSHGKTNQEGNYEVTYIRDIKGAKVGTHEITIRTVGPGYPGEIIPSQYNDKSTLTEEIAPGENTIDFKLVKK